MKAFKKGTGSAVGVEDEMKWRRARRNRDLATIGTAGLQKSDRRNKSVANYLHAECQVEGGINSASGFYKWVTGEITRRGRRGESRAK